ncbi:MAG: hypothetical protein L6V82_05470 [Clostridiales bacterium]|nr:MAG: hypothetical protein L6V82_05470 [Clostridiales bacterium]
MKKTSLWTTLRYCRQGHQICADSVVVEGSIEVNESLITGEPDAIVKKTQATALCREVTSYRDAQKQKVVHVGMDNFAMKISAGAKYFKKTRFGHQKFFK